MKNIIQFKFYFLLILLISNKCLHAQYGDAYHAPNTFALEQARQSRMQQNDDAHRSNINSSNSSNKSSGNYSTYIPSIFQKSEKPKPLTKEELEQRRKDVEEENRRKQREEADQKAKDDAWKKELNKLRVAANTAADKTNSYQTRNEAIQFLYNYLDSSNTDSRQKAIRSSGAKNAPFLSFEGIYTRLGDLNLEYKNYANAYYNYEKANNERVINPIMKSDWLWNNSYYLNSLLFNSNDYEFNVLQTAKAYVYNMGKINSFAYALFLNNELSNACNAYQHYMNSNSNSVNDSIKTTYLTRMIAMHLINGNNTDALELVHKNFNDTIQNIENIKSIISGMLANEVELLESKKYKIPGFSTLFDLDLLCKLYPNDKEANKRRIEYGKLFGNPDRQKNINELWSKLPKSRIQFSLEEHFKRGSNDAILNEAITKLGTTKKMPILKNYELTLRDLNAYIKREYSNNYHSFAVKDGYLILNYKVFKPYYIKIEDFKGIYYTSDDKDLKLYGNFYNAHNESVETEQYIFRANKNQSIEPIKELLNRLFKELKKTK